MADKDKKGKSNPLSILTELGNFPAGADPAYNQEARAIVRGLQDLLKDTKREKKHAKQDFRTTRKDIKVDRSRSIHDLGRELERGLLDIRYQRQDTKQELERGTEDFTSRLTDLARAYTQQGVNQGQQINAAGAGAASGLARAAAAKRAENMAYDRKPLDVAMGRLEEDVGTTLGRLGTAAGQLRQDTQIASRRVRKDTRHDLGLARRDFRRDRRDIKTERQRAKREATITAADLLSSAVWAARRS